MSESEFSDLCRKNLEGMREYKLLFRMSSSSLAKEDYKHEKLDTIDVDDFDEEIFSN